MLAHDPEPDRLCFGHTSPRHRGVRFWLTEKLFPKASRSSAGEATVFMERALIVASYLRFSLCASGCLWCRSRLALRSQQRAHP